MANFVYAANKHTQNKATTLIFQYDVHEYFPCMNKKKSLKSMRKNKKKCTYEKTGTRAVTNFQTA